jgi:hypothetical protein
MSAPSGSSSSSLLLELLEGRAELQDEVLRRLDLRSLLRFRAASAAASHWSRECLLRHHSHDDEKAPRGLIDRGGAPSYGRRCLGSAASWAQIMQAAAASQAAVATAAAGLVPGGHGHGYGQLPQLRLLDVAAIEAGVHEQGSSVGQVLGAAAVNSLIVPVAAGLRVLRLDRVACLLPQPAGGLLPHHPHGPQWLECGEGGGGTAAPAIPRVPPRRCSKLFLLASDGSPYVSRPPLLRAGLPQLLVGPMCFFFLHALRPSLPTRTARTDLTCGLWPRVQEFSAQEAWGFGDEQASALAAACPQLRRLRLSHDALTSRGWAKLLGPLAALQELHVEWAAGLDDAALLSKGAPQLSSAGRVRNSCSRPPCQLRQVHLDHCPRVTDLGLRLILGLPAPMPLGHGAGRTGQPGRAALLEVLAVDRCGLARGL